MPATSGKQYRFMAGIANGMKSRSGKGPSKDVAKEFVDKTSPAKRSAFSRGRKKKSLFAK